MRHRRARMLGVVAIAAIGIVCYVAWQLATIDRQTRIYHQLIDAIKRNNPARVQTLLANGANPNCRESKRPIWQIKDLLNLGHRAPEYGPTALHIALGERLDGYQSRYPRPNKEIIVTLLANGAAINALDQGHETALMFAADYLDADVISLLVEKGADVNAKSDTGYTALHKLVMRNDSNLISYLVAHGADVNAHTRPGTTPLHIAVVMSDPAVVQLLLNKGADPNAQASYQGTPLAAMAVDRSVSGNQSDYRQIVSLLKHFSGRLVFGSATKGLPFQNVKKYTERVSVK